MLLEGSSTLSMNIAHGRANLSIRVALNIFEQEIEQPAFTLQQGQQTQGCSGGLGRGLGLGGHQQRFHLGRKCRIAQDPQLAPQRLADATSVAPGHHEKDNQVQDQYDEQGKDDDQQRLLWKHRNPPSARSGKVFIAIWRCRERICVTISGGPPPTGIGSRLCLCFTWRRLPVMSRRRPAIRSAADGLSRCEPWTIRSGHWALSCLAWAGPSCSALWIGAASATRPTRTGGKLWPRQRTPYRKMWPCTRFTLTMLRSPMWRRNAS